MATKPKYSPHFLARDVNGKVTIRMRFTDEEAAIFEEAAGKTPVIEWLHQALNRAGEEAVREVREERKHLPPPE